MVRARARKGHPGGGAFAMQSQHIFWFSRLPVWYSREPLRDPGKRKRPTSGLLWTKEGHSERYGRRPAGFPANSLGSLRGAGGYWGFNPGRSKS